MFLLSESMMLSFLALPSDLAISGERRHSCCRSRHSQRSQEPPRPRLVGRAEIFRMKT